MTPREFAVFMRSLGATWAVNLDGGASTTMVVRGDVMNSPSDPNGERSVSHAVVLLADGRPGMFHLGAQLHELDGLVDPVTPGSSRSAEDIHASNAALSRPGWVGYTHTMVFGGWPSPVRRQPSPAS